MQIVLLLATADAVGGTEIVTRAYAEALARGDEVAILSVYRTCERDVSIANVRSQFLIDASLGKWRPLIDLGVSEVDAERLAGIPSEVVPDEWDSQFNRLSDLALERALSALSCQVIVTTSPALLALAVRFRRANVRIFHQEHRASEFRRGSMLPLARHGPSTNGVGFLTEASRDFFDGLWGSGAPPLHVLTNPVTDEFRPRSTLEERAVIMAARLVPEKQIEHAVVAFWEATQRLPGWQLRVFGEGPHRRRLRRLIQALHVEDRVLLLGSTSTMHLEWARGSIALLTSRYEGFSLALAEAQTAGLPIVSYDSPNGPREIVRDGIDGRLVPLNDRRALAASLRVYMEDADSRRDAGNAARAVSGRFSVASATVRLRRALEMALEDRSTSWHRVAAASITTLAHEPARDPGVSGEKLPGSGTPFADIYGPRRQCRPLGGETGRGQRAIPGRPGVVVG